MKLFFYYFFFVLFVVSCEGKKQQIFIKNKISYPVSLTPVNSSSFLLLNSDANFDYIDGSIHRYSVDASGSENFESAFSIPPHASDLALSQDSKLLAIGFDAAVSQTKVQFFDYSNPSQPIFLDKIALNLKETSAKQSVKKIKFFVPTTNGGDYYYIYGTIFAYRNDNGDGSDVPNRVFVARIAKNFSKSEVLFYLSYGLNDPSSLVQKSDSLNPFDNSIQYRFGTSAPTYDALHDIFIALPTGSKGGYNNTSYSYPPMVTNMMDYLSKASGTSNRIVCSSTDTLCIQPDLRLYSLVAVDFKNYLSTGLLNNNVYFVPLVWNFNGIPYGARSNGVSLAKGELSVNAKSLSFQTEFWESYWLGAEDSGNDRNSCYSSENTTAVNQYNLSQVGSNGILFSKSGPNGSFDSNYGNEVFQLTGLDILSSNINTIRSQRGYIASDEVDFKNIENYQILDPYNTLYSTISTYWLNGSSGVKNAFPLTPYIYSRTANISSFDNIDSAAVNFGVINFENGGKCLPFWVRNTISGAAFGIDSAWISANPVFINGNTNPIFPDVNSTDPSQTTSYDFPWGDGAQSCTYMGSAIQKLFCVNYLTGKISHFSLSQTPPVFSKL